MQTTSIPPLALDAPGFLIPRAANEDRAAVLDWVDHVAAGRIGSRQPEAPEIVENPCPEHSRRGARWDALIAATRRARAAK